MVPSGNPAGTRRTRSRWRDADEAERLVADRFEAVQLVAGDVDHVAGAELVKLVPERHPRAAVLDHDAVVVWMLLERGAAARRHREVAHAVGRRPVGGADQLV